MAKTTNILDLNNRLEKVEKGNIAQNNYNSLKNRPKINGNLLTGDKTSTQLGLANAQDIGNLSDLNTTDKSSCVGAINEVKASKSNLLVFELKQPTTGEVSANSYKDFTVSVAKSGYTPIGIVGVRVAGATVLGINYFYLDSTNATLRINNNTSTAVTPDLIYIWVLYVQN